MAGGSKEPASASSWASPRRPPPSASSASRRRLLPPPHPARRGLLRHGLLHRVASSAVAPSPPAQPPPPPSRAAVCRVATASRLLAPLQPSCPDGSHRGQGCQKAGRSRGSCGGTGFCSSLPPPPRPKCSRVGVPEELLHENRFLRPFGGASSFVRGEEPGDFQLRARSGASAKRTRSTLTSSFAHGAEPLPNAPEVPCLRRRILTTVTFVNTIVDASQLATAIYTGQAQQQKKDA
jgi:hypothetical protein